MTSFITNCQGRRSMGVGTCRCLITTQRVCSFPWHLSMCSVASLRLRRKAQRHLSRWCRAVVRGGGGSCQAAEKWNQEEPRLPPLHLRCLSQAEELSGCLPLAACRPPSCFSHCSSLSFSVSGAWVSAEMTQMPSCVAEHCQRCSTWAQSNPTPWLRDVDQDASEASELERFWQLSLCQAERLPTASRAPCTVLGVCLATRCGS